MPRVIGAIDHESELHISIWDHRDQKGAVIPKENTMLIWYEGTLESRMSNAECKMQKAI